MPDTPRSDPADVPGVWKTHGWKIMYFAAGILFIGLGKHLVPFWGRICILAGWAIGLALIFLKTMGENK